MDMMYILLFGPRNNIKVTTPSDYYIIQALYKYEEDEYKTTKRAKSSY